MYIRKTSRIYKGKEYANYLLVESVQTPKGPRQRTICSLGNLAPAPREQWRALAHKLESALCGQLPLEAPDEKTRTLLERAGRGRQRREPEPAAELVTVDAERIELEQAREAGPVHVGHQMWRRLGMGEILRRAGLSECACRLSAAMTLNRLICPLSERAMPDWSVAPQRGTFWERTSARCRRMRSIGTWIGYIRIESQSSGSSWNGRERFSTCKRRSISTT